MHVNFFPSRQISLYMARLFLTRTFAVLAMLVVVLQTLDLLGNSGDILAYPGNSSCGIMWGCARRRSSPASCPFRCCWARW